MVRDLKCLYGRLLTTEFQPTMLKALRQTWLELVDDDGRRPLTRSTIIARVQRICRMFRRAASDELVPASVLEALGMVTGLRERRTGERETCPVLPVDDVIDKTVERAYCRRLRDLALLGVAVRS